MFLASITAPPAEAVAFRNSKGKTVGYLSPDLYLEKRGVEYDKHHLYGYGGGWATEAHHIDILMALKGVGVRLHLLDGRVFESTLSDWVNYGFQPKGLESLQTVLADRYWHSPQ